MFTKCIDLIDMTVFDSLNLYTKMSVMAICDWLPTGHIAQFLIELPGSHCTLPCSNWFV